jgi:hypothetical protein
LLVGLGFWVVLARRAGRWVVGWSHRADDEVLAGGVDDFLGDDGHVVDLQDAFDLADEADGEPELPLVMRAMAAMASVVA